MRTWKPIRRSVRWPVMAVLAACATVVPVVVAAPALAHEERDVTEPRRQPFPEVRDSGPAVVVCKPDSRQRIRALPAPLRQRNLALLERCRFEHIQQAVNWIRAEGESGTRILVQPGVYREEPSRDARERLHGAPVDRPELAADCAGVAAATGGGKEPLTYEQQVTCPHLQNLVAVLGDRSPHDGSIACDNNLCDLQIEGTGGRPRDVIVDGKLAGFLNGIRADRAGGFTITNVAAQRFEFNGVYIIETSGATIDDVDGSFNHEYGFLSFVSYVRYENCSGQANGDSAIYPGASPNALEGRGLIPRHRDDMRFATEVRGCRGHHNALGYSGTSGNAVFAHHNEFDHNATGAAMDSLFPGHPGTPQNHTLFEDNLFHENNVNYYARHAQRAGCTGPLDERDYEDGAVCPSVPLPVGTGTVVAGGNYDWFHRNRFYDNWRQGTFQFWVPAELREGTVDPDAHIRDVCGPDGGQLCPPQETSHWNTYSANRLADNAPQSYVQPNGADFGWDLEGQGNCWDQTGSDANTSAAGPVTYSGVDTTVEHGDLPAFPACERRALTYSPAATNALEAGCINYDQAADPDPAGCDWFEPLSVPAGRQPAHPTVERLAGADPVDTAILAAREGYPSDAGTVVLAAADNPSDALVAAPLAHARGGPVLLTGSDNLDPRTAEEIRRLGATTAVLVGNRRTLSPNVVSDLRRLDLGTDDIVRLGGDTSAATAAAVARSLGATDAFVVRTDDGGWRDVLTLGSVAALLERPILLTGRDELPPPTREVLGDGAIEAVDIVGGTTSVSDAVARSLADRLDDVERVGGADPSRVALELARFALQAGADPTELWLASGDGDAGTVAAGSAVAVDEGVTLLVRDGLAGTPAGSWLESRDVLSPGGDATVADILERVRVLGDTSAVSPEVVRELRDRYGARPGDARGDRATGDTRWQGRITGGADGANGSAEVTETLVGSTRLRLQVAGLAPGRDYTATVQAGSCGSDPRPLTFPGDTALRVDATADDAGTAIADDTVFEVADADPGSIGIRDGDRLVACADLG